MGAVAGNAKQCRIQVHLSSNNFCGEQKQKPINEHTITRTARISCILSVVSGVRVVWMHFTACFCMGMRAPIHVRVHVYVLGFYFI